LHRFYDPTSGKIKIDNHDLCTLALKDIRRSIGSVSQENFIFRGTVEENIRYGRLEATLEEVRSAAVAAWADEFIQVLPNGYQELIGPRGVTLSAGQRQRLALARLFLANSPILLLDEATSSLDPDSEQKVQQAFSRLLRSRTTLIIAHRMATARMADRILVFEHGRLIDSGPHETLFTSSELYRRYWELQSLKEPNGSSEYCQKETGLAPIV
jgi:ABC-type multidrug transport system fused ATPase/permease subunit